MLPAEYRLKINNTTTRSWKKKKEIFTPGFKLVYEIFSDDQKPKIGFIVSGKTGNSVERNRTRRFLIEEVRGRIDKFPKGTRAIFIATQKGNFKHEDISDWVEGSVEKIKKSNQGTNP